jgi:exosortase
MSVTTDRPSLEKLGESVPPPVEPPLGSRGPRVPPAALATLAVAIGMTVIVYWGAMIWWVSEWTREGSFYAHGIFIPFFVGLMVWRDRERLRRLPMERCWWGLPLIVFALILVLASARAQVIVPVSISFILFLIGTTLVAAGKRITRALLFPMLFLFTMIPIVPDQLINPIAFPIQIVSAKMAAALCSLIGFSAKAHGTSVQLQNYTMTVELPCSGFKTLLGLLSFSAAFAYVVEGKTWKRWLLFAVSGPLAILVNGLRISLIGLVGETRGGESAKMFHDYSGFIVLILGFTFLFNLARILKCDNFLGVPLTDPEDRKPGESEKESTAADAGPRETDRQAEYNAKWGPPRRVAFGALSTGLYPVIVLLLLVAAAKPAITKTPLKIPPVNGQEIPLSLNSDNHAWKIQMTPSNTPDIPITPDVQEALKPRAYINRIYDGANSGSGQVELLLTAGDGRKSFHDPHTCFLGNGYDMRDVRVETIDTPAGPLKVQVAEAESSTDHSRTLLMFCYIVDGKQYQTTQQMNTALVFQLLFGDSGRPSYFLRFRETAPGTEPAKQEELKSFIRSVWASIATKVVGADKVRQAATH